MFSFPNLWLNHSTIGLGRQAKRCAGTDFAAWQSGVAAMTHHNRVPIGRGARCPTTKKVFLFGINSGAPRMTQSESCLTDVIREGRS
jgi:hypothetical protein